MRWLFRNELATEAWAPEVTEPVLILHGEADEMIPPAHARHLAAIWKGPAELHVLPSAGHNDLGLHPQLRPAVEAFLAAHLR